MSKDKKIENPRILVIGLDGATFKILKPLLEKRKKGIPNISKLVKKGVHGKLKSVIPPLSIYSWPTFFTGTNAGKLGIFALNSLTKKDETFKMENKTANASFVTPDSLWKILSDYGFKVGVVNVPVTFPPEEVNGFLISGFLSPSHSSEYTYPKELKKYLNKNGYKIDVEFNGKLGVLPEKGVNKEIVKNKLYNVLKKRAELSNKLIKKNNLDFFIVNFKELDVIQHIFWDEKKEINNFLEKIDEKIEKLRDAMGPDITIIMSDHGFHGRSNKYFHINTWLKRKGYLETKNNFSTQMKNFIYSKGINLTKNFDFIRSLVPEKIKSEAMNENAIFKRVNKNKTLFYGSRWGIYFNYNNSKNNYENLIKKLKKELLQYEYKGNSVFKEIHTKKELFKGPYKDTLPDLIPLPNKKFKINPNFHTDIVTERVDMPYKTGDHNADPFGIFIIEGDGIREGKVIDNAKLIDLAPTILVLMKIPIPPIMDGKFLSDVVKEKYDIKEIKETEKEKIRENIKLFMDC